MRINRARARAAAAASASALALIATLAVAALMREVLLLKLPSFECGAASSRSSRRRVDVDADAGAGGRGRGSDSVCAERTARFQRLLLSATGERSADNAASAASAASASAPTTRTRPTSTTLPKAFRQCASIRNVCLLENDLVLMGPPPPPPQSRDAEAEEEVVEPADILSQSIDNPREGGNLIEGIRYNLPGWHDGLNGTQDRSAAFPLNIRVRSNLDPPELLSLTSAGSSINAPPRGEKVEEKTDADEAEAASSMGSGLRLRLPPLVLLWRTWPYNFNESGKWLFDLASMMLMHESERRHREQRQQLGNGNDHAHGASSSSASASSSSSPSIHGFAIVPPRRTRIASFWSLLGHPIVPSSRSYYDEARYCPDQPPPCFDEVYICDDRMTLPRADSRQLEAAIDRMVDGSCSGRFGIGGSGSGSPAIGTGTGSGEEPADEAHRRSLNHTNVLRIWIDDANRPGPKKREILNPDEIMGFCRDNTVTTADGREIRLICRRGKLTDSAAMACQLREYDVLIAITGASVANGLFLRKGGSIIQVEYKMWSPYAAEDNWGGQPLFDRLDTLQPLHYSAPREDTVPSPIVEWCERKGHSCGIARLRDASVRVSWPLLKPLLEKAVQHLDSHNSRAGERVKLARP